MLGVVLERGVGDKIGTDCGPLLRHAEKINQIKKTKDSKRDKTILDIFLVQRTKKKNAKFRTWPGVFSVRWVNIFFWCGVCLHLVTTKTNQQEIRERVRWMFAGWVKKILYIQKDFGPRGGQTKLK